MNSALAEGSQGDHDPQTIAPVQPLDAAPASSCQVGTAAEPAPNTPKVFHPS